MNNTKCTINSIYYKIVFVYIRLYMYIKIKLKELGCFKEVEKFIIHKRDFSIQCKIVFYIYNWSHFNVQKIIFK